MIVCAIANNGVAHFAPNEAVCYEFYSSTIRCYSARGLVSRGETRTLNKTRRVGLSKRRKLIAKLHAREHHAPTPQKGPRSERQEPQGMPTLALTPLPKR